MKITERLYKIFPATFPRFHITIERWKFNEQHKVWVSNQGNVLDEEKSPIRVKTTNRKYMVCVINHIPVSLHRLVLTTWKPCKNMEKLTVDHLDSNPRNNRLSNLEWVTEQENKARAAENYFSISPSEEEKFEARLRSLKAEEKKEREANFGMRKEEMRDKKLNILTERFTRGELKVECNGMELNIENCFEFFVANNGSPSVPVQRVVRRLITHAYSGSKYIGKVWKFKGNIEISKEEIILNV